MTKENSSEMRTDPLQGGDAFSFTKSAEKLGQVWETTFEDHKVRTPLEETGEGDDTLVEVEKRAHTALGLEPGEKFIVIVRVRSHKGIPQVLQRVYLRPDNFPATFLDDHDFAHESLIQIYQKYGYQLTSRNSTLTARVANLYETIELKERNDLDTIPLGKPVLVTEQELFAVNPKTGAKFLLEYLEATYVDWSYRIENLPAIHMVSAKQ